MIEYLSNPVFMKICFIVILLLLLYLLIRFICYGEQSNNFFSNSLIKYISNNEEKYHNYSSSNSKGLKNEKQSNKAYKNPNYNKNGLDLNEEHAPLNSHINIDFMGESEFANSANDPNENNSFANLTRAELQEKEAKILRFAIDYCRASPNIHLKSKSILSIGWRSSKFHFDVDLELANAFNFKVENENSIMTVIPINKALINFEDVLLKEGFVNLIQSFRHRNILKNSHLDVLKNQNLMVKIQKFYENGSLKDVLFKSNPKKTYAQKYSNNTRGKPLHASLIALYGRQILEALQFLHSNKWYHLHLHSGNVLVDEKNQQVKITELENFVCDLPLKNEQYFHFIYEEFNYDKNANLSNANNLKDYQNEKLNFNNNNNNNNNLFSDIFKIQFNVFEKIDIISFGRILYEMTTGKELKSPFPDELEYKDMDIEIAQILRAIFQRKNSKFQYSNQFSSNNNNNLKASEITAAGLLKLKFFDPENTNKLSDLTNQKGKNANSDLRKNEDLDTSQYDEVSRLNLDVLDPNDPNKSGFISSSEHYCSGIKEKIFNQNSFLQQKNKLLNKFI